MMYVFIEMMMVLVYAEIYASPTLTINRAR